MQTATYLRTRPRLLVGVLVIATLAGLVAAAISTGSLSVVPPKLESGALQVSTATTHVLIDEPSPSIVYRRALPQDVTTLVQRGELLSRLMASPPVLSRIAQRAGLPPSQLGAVARTSANVPTVLIEPDSERRANEILQSRLPYRLELQARPTTPIVDIYSLAPSTAEAERLANSVVTAVGDYLDSLAARRQYAGKTVELRQLGKARGGVVYGRAGMVIALLAFGAAFVLTCAALLAVLRLWLAKRLPLPQRGQPPSEPDPKPNDDWPGTLRLLPWMLAAFIAMLWLVPFNVIELKASGPIDLKLDRLLLPLIAALWVVALLSGGKGAPNLRVTWIHAALGAFLACAFLSVIFGASYLSQTLELDLAFKKLPLLIAYASLFVVVASSVRRTEIRPFLSYTLVLAVICAAGIIWEYRFQQNLFQDWTNNLLPSFFAIGPAEAGDAGVDNLARPSPIGPADVGVEAVSMLAMALPIALVGLLQAARRRERILYGLAACVLMAGTVATFRKSGLLAPASVILTLAYFRRRELLKLAPLALVLVVVVHAVSPGALGSTISQFFRSDRLAVGTVSDRASDYDAVRPDLWTHLLFGRGVGTYNHETYRILDSEILHRTVEMGVLGLIAFLLVGASVVLGARSTIVARDPTWAPVALIGAAAAVCFLVVSTLFDVLSFPHATYVFLYMAGLVAVVIAPEAERREPEPPSRHTVREHHVRRGHAAGRLYTPPAARAR